MLTSTILSGGLTWIITNVLPIVLAAVFKAMSDRSVREQTRSDQIGLGQERAASKVNLETSNAERRASDAMLNTGGVDDLLAGMDAGKL